MKILVTDMDDTLLDRQHTYDRAKLEELLDQDDLIFVAASGRPLSGVAREFEGLEDRMVFVGSNGSIASHRGELLFVNSLPASKISGCQAYLDQNPELEGEFVAAGLNSMYVLDSIPEHRCTELLNYSRQVTRVASFDELAQIDDPIISATVIFPEGRVLAGEKRLSQVFPDVNFTTSGFRSVDMICKNVNKAFALEKLADHFGVELGDIHAFGDNYNDLEMLGLAGHSYAVSNAVPELLELADTVIGHHCEDAVLDTMLEIARG